MHPPYRTLFMLSKMKYDSPRIGDSASDVVLFNTGELAVLTGTVVGFGPMQPEFEETYYTISKEKYRKLLHSAIEEGVLTSAKKIEELEALGKE